MIRISMALLGSVMLAINAAAQPADRPPGTDGNQTAPACKEMLECAGGKWPDPTIEACTAALARPCTEMFSRNPEAHGALFFHRAHAYFTKRDYDLALADFDEAIRLTSLENFEQKPRALAEALSYRCIIHIVKHQEDFALADIDEAIAPRSGERLLP